ncbi:MAG: hypothetical protein R3F34_09945 [Planctomycetota bacterium]
MRPSLLLAALALFAPGPDGPESAAPRLRVVVEGRIVEADGSPVENWMERTIVVHARDPFDVVSLKGDLRGAKYLGYAKPEIGEDGAFSCSISLDAELRGNSVQIDVLPDHGRFIHSEPVYVEPVRGVAVSVTAAPVLGEDGKVHVDLGDLVPRPAPPIGTLRIEADEDREIEVCFPRAAWGTFRSPISRVTLHVETNRTYDVFTWIDEPFDAWEIVSREPGHVIADPDVVRRGTSIVTRFEKLLAIEVRPVASRDSDSMVALVFDAKHHVSIDDERREADEPVRGRSRQRVTLFGRYVSDDRRWFEDGRAILWSYAGPRVLEVWRKEDLDADDGRPVLELAFDLPLPEGGLDVEGFTLRVAPDEE